MPLAAAHLLATVVAALLATLLGGLDRLAVDDRDTGLVVAAGLVAHVAAEHDREFVPDAAVGPGAEVVVAGPPGRELVGQQTPLAAATDQIQQGVDDLA